MEFALAVSGMLALLGGGAGALAYYRKNFAAGGTRVGPIRNVVSPNPAPDNPTGFGGVGSEVAPPITPDAGVVSPLPANIGQSEVIDTGTAPPSPSIITPAPGYHAAPPIGTVDTASTPPATPHVGTRISSVVARKQGTALIL